MAEHTKQPTRSAPRAALSQYLNRLWFSLPIRYKGAAVISFPAICLILSLLWYDSLHQNVAAAEAWVKHTQLVRLEAGRLQNALVDSETGVRGYDITRRPEFLEPYLAARDIIPTSLRTLDELVQDNPTQSQRVRELQGLTQQRLDNLAANLATIERGDTNNLTARLVEGKSIMDTIRQRLDTFLLEEQRLQDERTLILERQQQTTQIVFGVAMLIGVGGSVLAVFLFSFGITRRVDALIENAWRLARGAPLLPTVPGKDEISVLDHELNATARILADREQQLQRKNKELVEQNRRVQEATRLKSEFLANMSHELRTPLNGIIGFAELMHDGVVGPVSDEHKEYLDDILTSARHLLQLINDILDLAKVESGKVEFRPEPIDPARLVGEVRDILRTLVARKRIVLETVIAPDLDQIMLDPARLKQILYNYLSNALKFTPDGGQVTVRLAPEGAAAFRVEVADTGIGIRPEDQGRLFVEFEQLDASASKKYAGTGLGLALTKRIVEAQGGTVGVRSMPGQGSVFFAVLPRVYRAEPTEEIMLPVAPYHDAPTILVIEDEPSDRTWLTKTLTEAGYAVQVAATGAEALAKCHERAFDAITLDLLLPDTGGWDVLRAIRATDLNHDVPAIVVSLVAEKEAGVGFSVHDFLVKPTLSEELLASLERAGVLPGGGAAVLVVDDDPNALKLMEITLSRLGVRPICRLDVRSALQAAAQEPPVAVILDLLMPGMDGFAFLERFRQSQGDRHIPVIIWTNKDLTEEERAQLQRGAEAVVMKGQGSPAALLEELRAYLPMREETNDGRRADLDH